MAATRTLTATAPDGTQVSTNVGAKRVVGAIRITAAPAGETWNGSPWLVTVHRSLDLAIKGSNQTTAWNSFTRWAIAIDQDQAVGPWLGASL